MSFALDKLARYKGIGIMGGTFDPIHYGHLAAAEAAREEFALELVLFIPTGAPAHKKGLQITPGTHRLTMTELAAASNPCFAVSPLEIERTGTTYTIDTIRALKAHMAADARLYFITGADALQEIRSWKDTDALLALCDFIAVTRPGYEKETLQQEIKELQLEFQGRLHYLSVPGLDISATALRVRVKTGKSIKYLLPEPVEAYIARQKLYQDNSLTMMRDYIRVKLSPKRFQHSLGVAEEAVRLAKHYGADSLKATTAALLHDCAKDLSPAQTRAMCRHYAIPLTPILEKQIDLAHPFIGAAIAQDLFAIQDEEILNAIRYHTTGRGGMTLLEKIIFTADGIEPGRESYKGLSRLRKTAYRDLDETIRLSLKETLEYNKKKGREIHPLSNEALEALEKACFK